MTWSITKFFAATARAALALLSYNTGAFVVLLIQSQSRRGARARRIFSRAKDFAQAHD
jgi:hypothetical protein